VFIYVCKAKRRAVSSGIHISYEDVKQQLTELVEWPLLHPEAFARLGVTAARGVLLHGPSGCGKTLLATALLRKLPFNHFSAKGFVCVFCNFGGVALSAL
jgi:SpoVK/Ycf46/Vps4 family AAA+-type ATPase